MSYKCSILTLLLDLNGVSLLYLSALFQPSDPNIYSNHQTNNNQIVAIGVMSDELKNSKCTDELNSSYKILPKPFEKSSILIIILLFHSDSKSQTDRGLALLLLNGSIRSNLLFCRSLSKF